MKKDKSLLIRKEKALIKKRKTRLKALEAKGRPRLIVVKTTKHTGCQLIDDAKGKVLMGLTDAKISAKGQTKTEKAKLLGEQFGKMLKEKKINRVVFDRHGFPYQGRVKALAEAVKQQGIKF